MFFHPKLFVLFALRRTGGSETDKTDEINFYRALRRTGGSEIAA